MLKLYNDLTSKKEYFKLDGDVVRFYSCGPTVYNYVHIGNLRTFSYEDVLVRLLEYKGYKVIHVRNLTDVEDKIIKNLKINGLTLKDYTNKYADAFFSDSSKMRFLQSDFYPRATEYVNDMVDFIIDLEQKGFAYKGDDNSYYFKVSKFEGYGKLSGAIVQNLKMGAGGRVRNDEYDKESASDFALWKAYDSDDGDVYWDTKIGKGRPGWHIECSVMASKLLGNTIDIHSGGEDLMFPHHENEISQTEARYGSIFARFWMHSKHLLVDGKKMSKSLNNFYTLRDIEAMNINPLALKHLYYTAHYRNQLNFTIEALKSSQKFLEDVNLSIMRLTNYYSPVDVDSVDLIKDLDSILKKFIKSLDDDINMPQALVNFGEFIKLVNVHVSEADISIRDARRIISMLRKFDSLLGLFEFEQRADDRIFDLVITRQELRSKKQFNEADKIRADIEKQGYFVNDLKKGFTLTRLQST